MRDTEVRRLLARLVRIGTVTDRDAEQGTVRVKFHAEGIISGWLRVLQHGGAGLLLPEDGEHSHTGTDSRGGGVSLGEAGGHTHTGAVLGSWLPEIDTPVLCLYLPCEDSDGFVLGAVS